MYSSEQCLVLMLIYPINHKAGCPRPSRNHHPDQGLELFQIFQLQLEYKHLVPCCFKRNHLFRLLPLDTLDTLHLQRTCMSVRRKRGGRTEESRNFEGLNLLFLSDTTEKQRKKMQFLGPLGYLSLSRD